MKYFKTNKWAPYITEVDVVRVTEKFVVTKRPNGMEDRHAKVSEYNAYFETWDEAFDHVRIMHETSVRDAWMKLWHAEWELSDVMDLKTNRS